MPRFRTDSVPVPVRRFVLPEGEHATAPALPEVYTHVKAPEWGAGVARQTYRRPVQPKRTPERPAEAQTGARGLYTAKAPIAARKGRRILDFTAATETPMVAFMGTIRLDVSPEAVDLRRLELGIMRLAVDHDTTKLMGRITEATIGSGQLDMLAEVGDTPTAISAMSEIDDLLRQGFSPDSSFTKPR